MVILLGNYPMNYSIYCFGIAVSKSYLLAKINTGAPYSLSAFNKLYNVSLAIYNLLLSLESITYINPFVFS